MKTVIFICFYFNSTTILHFTKIYSLSPKHFLWTNAGSNAIFFLSLMLSIAAVSPEVRVCLVFCFFCLIQTQKDFLKIAKHSL